MRSIKLPKFRRRFVSVPIYRPIYGLRREQLQNLGVWSGDVAYDIVGYRKHLYLKYVG